MQSHVRIRSAVKRFGKTVALGGVNFSSVRGINLILGPNGAGKSTLLRCIDGLYRLDSGSIEVLGSDPYANNKVKERLSLLTDNYALYDFLTVSDNLRFFGRLYGLKDSETLEIASGILGRLEALRYMNQRVGELSRGTKQKIAFCRSVLNDPEVLLLDEPTAFLDAHSAEMVRKVLLDYERRGKTILFVTQKLDEVTRFNGSISIIRSGRIIKDTTTEGLYSMALKNTVIDVRIARPIDAGEAESIPGFLEANAARATFLKFRIRNYKGIDRVLRALMRRGAKVVSMDFVEHLIEDLSR